MSRIGYSDDEDFPGQFGLWQGNVRRSIRGKAGQAALRELEVALLALPEKRLIAGELENAEGEVCAIGALKRYQGVEAVESNPAEDMEAVGIELGMPRLVAWKVVCLNDIEIDGHNEKAEGPTQRTWGEGGFYQYIPATPEERYEKVLAWVRKQLAQPAGA